MKVQFYPYDFDYKISDGTVRVFLYSKLEDGTKICVVHEHEPYFYVRGAVEPVSVDTNREPAEITKIEVVEKELIGKTQPFHKVYTNYPKAVPVLAKHLTEKGAECYERDILFIHRYLRDMSVVPMTLTEAEGELSQDRQYAVPLFYATSVRPVSNKAARHWKILAVDIETYAETKQIDPHKNPILMIALYGIDQDGQEFTKVLTWKKFPTSHKYIEFVQDEAELLTRFRDLVNEYQPDIITGYYSDGFDFPYISVRSHLLKVKMTLGLDGSQLITGKSFREGTGKIKGILHVDVLKFIKYIFGKDLATDSFSLDAVSQELLGHKKHDVNLDDLPSVWNNHPEKLEAFCEYNLQDAKLAYQLCENLLPDMIEFTKIVGLPLFDVTRMRFSRLVESFILKQAMEHNVLAPNRPTGYQLEQRMDEHIKGAFVYEPTPGLYKDVAVFDFRSLYPTIITSHNLGPEGLCCECCTDNIVPEHPAYWFCRKKKFLPQVLEHLILRRMDLKKVIAETKAQGKGTKFLEARSYTLKILANSFYGYLGFFGARWYSLESAASTTAYARKYIKETIEKAEAAGFSVVYADTDSCFLLLGEKSLDDAMKFMQDINSTLPGYMELEFEGKFSRGIFVAVKGTDKGAKKKYALMNEGKLKITGFETVRRNWSKIAKDVQKNVLQLVLEDKADEAVEYVKDVASQLKAGSIPVLEVVIRTQITKELSQYHSIGPHVAVALQMVQEGQPVGPGTVVEYVIAKGTGLVRERARPVKHATEYDATYYLENQIIPAVMPIFEVLGYQEDQIFAESTQKGLGSFM